MALISSTASAIPRVIASPDCAEAPESAARPGEETRQVAIEEIDGRMDRACAHNWFTKAAVEMALWDLAGKAAGMPVYRLLGGRTKARIPVYASLTETGAREEPRESITAFFRRHVELMRATVGRAGAGPADRRAAKADKLERLPYDDMLRTRVAFGTAPQLIDRLKELQEQLGLDGIIVEPNPASLIPPEYVSRSLRIVARDVMPAFK